MSEHKHPMTMREIMEAEEPGGCDYCGAIAGTCGDYPNCSLGREHGKAPGSAAETPTPETDSLAIDCERGSGPTQVSYIAMRERARSLERRLVVLTERHADCRKMLEGEHDAHMECHRRADAAESALTAARAEVERLTAAWDRLVDVHRGWCYFCKGNEEWCLKGPRGGCTIRDYAARSTEGEDHG